MPWPEAAGPLSLEGPSGSGSLRLTSRHLQRGAAWRGWAPHRKPVQLQLLTCGVHGPCLGPGFRVGFSSCPTEEAGPCFGAEEPTGSPDSSLLSGLRQAGLGVSGDASLLRCTGCSPRSMAGAWNRQDVDSLFVALSLALWWLVGGLESEEGKERS